MVVVYQEFVDAKDSNIQEQGLVTKITDLMEKDTSPFNTLHNYQVPENNKVTETVVAEMNIEEENNQSLEVSLKVNDLDDAENTEEVTNMVQM